MKFVVSQLAYFLRAPKAQQNMKAMRAYLLGLIAIILFYSVIFHVLMEWLEGQQHSWLTGLYWTLTVMSTLGFGDITFTSDGGRIFSVIVLMSGILLLLVMLPFTFIQFFYAPWLEARIRMQAPRKLAPEVRDHVIICRYDSLTPGLIRHLTIHNIPYCVLEPDPAAGTQLTTDGISAIVGEVDSSSSYTNVNLSRARLVVANAPDAVNTNILLTIRALNTEVPILAIAEEEDSIDIFKLSGASHLLPLKVRLGEHLAARLSGGVGSAHEVGRFKDLIILEFLVHDTELAGKTLREAKLRESTGINVIGIWQGGHLLPVQPNVPLDPTSVPVAIGTEQQVKQLDALLKTSRSATHEVLVIGGGTVGISAARSLRAKGIHVRILDKDPGLREQLSLYADEVIIGNAADRNTLVAAGIESVNAVALTTNDDAQNIHLTVYCRRLRPDLNVVSRITRERNIEAIYRAGADFVLSYASLGREFIMAQLLGREPIMVGEGADMFSCKTPASLIDKRLIDSQIGNKTGLVVIAIETDTETITNPPPNSHLLADSRLLMLGTNEQWKKFEAAFQ